MNNGERREKRHYYHQRRLKLLPSLGSANNHYNTQRINPITSTIKKPLSKVQAFTLHEVSSSWRYSARSSNWRHIAGLQLPETSTVIRCIISGRNRADSGTDLIPESDSHKSEKIGSSETTVFIVHGALCNMEIKSRHQEKRRELKYRWTKIRNH